MVKMAQFQSNAKMFAGLHFDYGKPISTKKVKRSKNSKMSAVLGGGDMGFPLLFSGVLLKTFSIPQVAIVVFFTAAGLFALLTLSEKGKFYPAMPFITGGAFVGYLIAFFSNF